jgi:hypothetical protein
MKSDLQIQSVPGEEWWQRATHYHQYFASTLVWMTFSKSVFHLLFLLMARGRTKDGLCITGVYSTSLQARRIAAIP